MKLKQTLNLLAFQIFITTSVAGQIFETALKKYTVENPNEKIYIQYDKQNYATGETIWFKAYLYNEGLPSILSNNFYIQLLDQNGTLQLQNKYPVKGATVKGNIDLPDSLPQGQYYIRAFTPGMLNGDHHFLYIKHIFLHNSATQISEQFHKPVSGSVSVRFFPESGHLLEGVLTVVGFQAIDSLGFPVDVAGNIKTEDGTNIAAFKSFHDGIGKVQFKPQEGKKYVAVIDIGGQPVYFPLPPVETTGVSLKIENEKGGKIFQINRSKKEKDQYQKIWLVAEMNNKIVYENEIDFDNYLSIKGHLLTDSMPSGIIHFTVLNSELVPLAERLSFVNNMEYVSEAAIEIQKTGLGKRVENSLQISFPDKRQRSFSVSVTDAAASSMNGEDNIITSLLLTTDLKGYINNPAYYFKSNADSVQLALDNLMLTHGWTRYKWEKILSENLSSPKIVDNHLLSVSGYLKDSKTKQAVQNGLLSVYIVSEDSVNHNFEIKVDAAGRFLIDSLLVFGNTKINYAYTTAQGKEKPVDIYLEPLQAEDTALNLSFSLPQKVQFRAARDLLTSYDWLQSKYQPAVSKLEMTKELTPVVLEAKPTQKPIDIVNQKYTKGVFTAMGKVNIDNINEPVNDRSISVYDYIRNFIRQVEVQDNNFVNRRNFSLTRPMTQNEEKKKQEKIDAYLTSPYGVNGDKLPALLNENAPGKKFIVTTFLNESPVDISFLKTIRMEEVALLKFYDPGFIGAGTGGPGGALSIYTKQPVAYSGPGVEKLDYILYKGYTITKKFYSPDYHKTDSKSDFEDNRITLYWNPDLYTDNNTQSQMIKFFNNDFSKKLRVIVEGFDASGRFIYVEKLIGE